MNVSLVIVALDEAKYISKLLSDIKMQDYPLCSIELLLVDSGSLDETEKILQTFQMQNKKLFRDIQVLKNEKKILAAGWNVALRNYKGDLILRIDAHARMPRNFISKNVGCIEQGEYIVGGQRPTIVECNCNWDSILLLAEQSMFGSSIADYRHSKEKKYVKSVFHGAYRREVFENIGFFNENLGRTEDNDIHYRIRKAGYHICYDPQILSYQYIRPTLIKMIKQKFLNGYWIGQTLKIQADCLLWYHFIPFLFVLAILGSVASILFWGEELIGLLLFSLYFLFAFGVSLGIYIKKYRSCKLLILLPIIFFLLHCSYGIGTVMGLIKFK